MKRLFLSVALSGALLTMYSCNTKTSNESETETTDAMDMTEEDNMATGMEDEENVAVANLSPASGSNVTATATFTEENGAVTFELTAEHLTPGEHAVHLHENADCSAEDASSAGGHWNPANVEHGKRGNMPFHRGDVINLEVGEDSTGTVTLTVNNWTVGGPDSTNVVGHSVIIHADPDDFTSQPSGAAGSRVACGPIEMQ